MPGTPNTPTIRQCTKVIFIVKMPIKFIAYKIIAPTMLFFSSQNGSDIIFISAKIIIIPMIGPINICGLNVSKKFYFLSR